MNEISSRNYISRSLDYIFCWKHPGTHCLRTAVNVKFSGILINS